MSPILNKGVCPKCNGTRVIPLSPEEKKYSWNQFKIDQPCDNCGGQFMYGTPSGVVPLRKDTGEPCLHEYTSVGSGRGYTKYTCRHCGLTYGIDSGG